MSLKACSIKNIFTSSSQHQRDSFDLVFGPLIMVLRVFGIIFNSSSCRFSIGRIYSTAVLLLIWGTFVYSFKNYTPSANFDGDFLMKILTTNWNLFCALNILSWYLISSRNFEKFREKWNKAYEGLSIERILRIRNCILYITVFGVILVVLNFSLLFFISLTNQQGNSFIFPRNATIIIFSYVYFVSNSIFTSAVWILPLIAYSSFTTAIVKRFDEFNENLRQEVKRCNLSESNIRIGPFRRTHQKLTELVEFIDSNMSLQATGVIICNLIISCCSMYLFITFEKIRNELSLLLGMFFWTSTSLASIYVLVVGSSRVHNHVSITTFR